MNSYRPVELVKLAADEVLKICKKYSKEKQIDVYQAIEVLFKTYPDNIKQILIDRLDFYYYLNKSKRHLYMK